MKVMILGLYVAVLFIIGLVSSRKINGMSDFYVGGKRLGYWVAALSARATGESGWLLLGLTGMGAMMGVKAFWVVAGEVLGVTLCWLLMAKKFKWLTDKWDSITVTDYLVSRFQSKTQRLRVISATVLCVFLTIYISAQIDATGSAFETFFGWNYFLGVLAGFGIVVAYIYFGGFVAVAWSDLFQGVMMFLGLVSLPIIAYFSIAKTFGAGDLLSTLHSIEPALTSIWGAGGLTLMNVMGIIGFLMIGAGFLGSPQIFVRFISIKNQEEIKKGTVVAIIFTILTDGAAVLAGMMGRALLTTPGQQADVVLGNGAQNVLPLLVESLFPAVIVGFFIAVVLSAIMSTVDSLLVVASSAVTKDIYQEILHPETKSENLTGLSRKVTLILALASLTIALIVAVLSPTRTIFWFVMFGWSGIAASFCPMMILSLSWNKFTERGAISSMITGFLCIPFFSFIVPKIAVVGPYFAQLSALPPSIFLAICVGIFVSIRWPDQSLAAHMDNMDISFKNEMKAGTVLKGTSLDGEVSVSKEKVTQSS